MPSWSHAFLGTLLGVALVAAPATASCQKYDPLALPAGHRAVVHDLVVRDSARHRDIPIRIFLPATKLAAPVVLFSHGLGGSRQGSAYLGEHWSARGYVAVYLQHPGSDESVWRGVPAAQRMQALKQAANLENFVLRVQDVPGVLDQLERWNRSRENELFGRLDLRRVGMSGHSFGAVTTEAVSGESFLLSKRGYTDPRIAAAIAFSPSAPRESTDPRDAFGGVKIPWMLMTGTNDVSPIGESDASSRLNVYPALPPGGKYEIVLDGAEHSAFTDTPLPGDQSLRNPNHHRVILALSTAFWDAWLRQDPAAKGWLEGPAPRALMDPKDHWQHK